MYPTGYATNVKFSNCVQLIH